MKISAILLAGGTGSRMGAKIPKQFLPLQGKPIIQYSLEVLLKAPKISEIIVVCAPEYRPIFASYQVKFALQGPLRQDSVYHGFQQTEHDWVLVHDGARPFINEALINQLIEEGSPAGAASLAMPVKNTLKQVKHDLTVSHTLDRSLIWEIQTPQLLKKEILKKGFEIVRTQNLAVTDDVSLAELAGHPVKLVKGSYENIKITTPEDIKFAEWILQKNIA